MATSEWDVVEQIDAADDEWGVAEVADIGEGEDFASRLNAKAEKHAQASRPMEDMLDPFAAREQSGDPGFADDMANKVRSGAQGLRAGIGYLTGADEYREKAKSELDQIHGDLSPEQRASDEKAFFDKTEEGSDWNPLNYSFGDAWSDPRSVLGAIAESLPGTAAGMGAGAGVTKTIQAGGNMLGRKALTEAAKTGNKEAMKALAKREAIEGAVGFGAGEGLVSAGQTGDNVVDLVMTMPESVLQQSPAYRQLLQEGIAPEQAREKVAEAAASQAAWTSGTTTALLGAPMGAYFSRLFGDTAKVSSSRLIESMKGGAGEWAQETLQSGSEKALQNLAIQQHADPTQSVGEGVFNDMAAGGMAGGIMGGSVSFAGHSKATARGGAEPGATGTDPLGASDIATGMARPTNTGDPVQDSVNDLLNEADKPVETADDVAQALDSFSQRVAEQDSPMDAELLARANKQTADEWTPVDEQTTPEQQAAPLSGRIEAQSAEIQAQTGEVMPQESGPGFQTTQDAATAAEPISAPEQTPFDITERESGSILVKGDKAAIRQHLTDAGVAITGMGTKEGVVFGKGQAQAVRDALGQAPNEAMQDTPAPILNELNKGPIDAQPDQAAADRAPGERAGARDAQVAASRVPVSQAADTEAQPGADSGLDAPAAQGQGEPVPVTVEEFNAKSILIKGDKDAVRAKLAEVGIPKGLWNAKHNGIVLPKKYEAAVHEALERRTQQHPVAEEQRSRDRRKYDVLRDDIAAITDPQERAQAVEELRRMALTDHRTGLASGLALEQHLRMLDKLGKPYRLASLDVAGLKWVNDNMNPTVGDELIAKSGEMLTRANEEYGFFLASPKGDEFYAVVEGESDAPVREMVRKAQEIGNQAVLTYTLNDGTVIEKHGIDLYAGYGKNQEAADADLNNAKDKAKSATKAERQAQGITDDRLAEPRGVVRRSAEGRNAESNAPAEEVASTEAATETPAPAGVSASAAEKSQSPTNSDKISNSDETKAASILNAANVTGKDRLDIMAKFRAGEYSLQDLEEAYPSAQSTTSQATKPQQDAASVEAAAEKKSASQEKIEAAEEAKGAGNDAASFARRKQIETPEFKKWFGDSKVVDENGEPLVLFHQTDKNNVSGIEEIGFDLGREGARGSDPGMPDGVFLKPTDEDIAVGAIGEDAAQIPLYASIQNPLVVESRDELTEWLNKDSEYMNLSVEADRIDRDNDKEYAAIEKEVTAEAKLRGARSYVSQKDLKQRINEYLEKWRKENIAAATAARERATYLIKNAGHDGVIVKNDAGSFGRTTETIVALSPKQVKSAENNRGTFDPTDPRINYGRAITDEDLYRGTAETGLPVAEVEAIAAKMALGWGGNARNVYVHKDVASAPKRLAMQVPSGDHGNIQGIHDPVPDKDGVVGNIHLIASNLPTKRDVHRILGHEMAGHSAMEEIVDKGDVIKGGWQAVERRIDTLVKAGNKQARELHDEVRARGYDMGNRTTVTKEMLAVAVERNVTSGPIGKLLQQIRAAIRNLLRKAGINSLLPGADIDAMVIASLRYLKGSENQRTTYPDTLEHPQLGEIAVKVGKGRTGASKFVDQSPEVAAQLEDLVAGAKLVQRDADSATLENDGTTFHLIKEDGRWALTDAVNFSRSGDTLGGMTEDNDIFDGRGEDLVTLYHGTSAEAAKEIMESGVIESGRYYGGIEGVALTPRRDVAEDFAGEDGEVIEVRIPKDRLVIDPESYDTQGKTIDDAIDDGASVYADGSVALSRVNFARKGGDAFNLRDTLRRRGEQLSEAFDKFRYEAQDKHIYLKRMQEAIGNVNEETDAYGKEELYHGRVRYQIDKFHDDMIKPMLELVSMSGKTLEEVEEFLHARHAEEANAALREINDPGRPGYDALSGMTDEEARQIKAKHEGNRIMRAIGIAADRIGDFQLAELERNGLESAEFVQAARAKYKHYVPLLREAQPFETSPAGPGKGSGYNTAKKFLRRRAGSTRGVENILPNLIAQAEATIINSEKAKVHRAIYQMAEDNPDPGFWELDTTKKRYTVDSKGRVTLTGSPFDKEAENALRVRIDGEDRVIRFNSQNEHAMKMVAALRNMDQSQVGLLVRMGLTLNRYLSAINTGFNPEFIISNAVRDIQTAVYNLSSTKAEGIAKKMVKDWPKAFAGIRSALRSDSSHEWSKHFEEFRKAGAMTGWLEHTQTIEDFRKKVNREISDFGNSRKAKAKRGIRKMIDLVEDYNMVVENAVRLSAFVNAREAGLSVADSARMAKNLTVNFNRRGNKGVILNGLYLFYNASIQGSARLLQTVATSKKGRRLAAGTIAFAVMMDLLNRSMGGDDDDEVPWYDKIDDSVKERNLIFMDPFSDKGDYYKFPLPWGYNVFHVIGQKTGKGIYAAANPESATAKRTGMNDVADVLVSIANAFNPIGGGTLAQTVSPTIMDPLIQHAENKTWTGNDLMPQDMFGQVTPDSQKAWRSTPQVYKDMAEWLNEATGGNAARSGTIDTSPESIQMAYDTATGGLGRFVTGTIDTVMSAADSDTDIEAANIPMVRKLTGAQNRYTDQSRFYDLAAEVRTVKEEMEVLRGKDEYSDFIEKHGDKRKMIGMLPLTENRLKLLRRQHQRALERDDKVKAEEIEDKMWEEYKRFNKRYDGVTD